MGLNRGPRNCYQIQGLVYISISFALVYLGISVHCVIYYVMLHLSF